MRYVFRFWFALALSLALMAGCSEESSEGGSGGTAGTGGTGGEGGSGGSAGTGGEGGAGGSNSAIFPCTEQGILDAIALGGGPHTFACDGPTTVVTEDAIFIDKDVILDGEGNLTVDGNDDHLLFYAGPATVELRGFTVTNGYARCDITSFNPLCAAIQLETGSLTLVDSMVAGNRTENGGVFVRGRAVLLLNSTVSGNTERGIYVDGGPLSMTTLTMTNSTVSGNTGDGIELGIATLTMTNSTVSGNTGDGIRGSGTITNSTISANTGYAFGGAGLTVTNTLVDGDCPENVISFGHNIESPGNTCGFDQTGDQVNVSADDLKLGPLADNGGPTMTHELLPGSVAIDQIPAEDCVDADGQPLTTDQRGEPRPEPGGTMCDVGAFELQP